MYGLVNQAIQGLVTSRFGADVWDRIKSDAGVEVDTFLSMEPYDDSITYDLVGSASAALEMPAADVLRAFGEYWVLETAAKGYGDLMKAAGRTLPEFITNLDQLHSRVLMTFPNLRPPSFQCTPVGPGELHLQYLSEREGLEPFVEGLIAGLGKHFGTEVDVTMIQPGSETAGPAEFLVRYEPGPPH